ncbi:hypothetical protein NET02_11425 [Thermomicrobiaceae bacterium CFH 74404]|uniref:Uncharacterized protein n=1 Tax=Thermalbibacter longus TaxID=2951981 RepID=A0AA42BDH2_9BACT|nr:hypothetical protein [Thermalbibacter longus]MCM8749763.1 hypothetical protein [Thermalbibacter longus]
MAVAPIVSKLTQIASAYLDGKLSFDEFESEFIRLTWPVHPIFDELLQELVFNIDAAIVRYHEDILDEQEFRRELAALIRQLQVTVDNEAVTRTHTATMASTTHGPEKVSV